MAAGIDIYKALRPFRWDGKRIRRGGKIAMDMGDRALAVKVSTLVRTRWIELFQLGPSAAKGAS